MESLTSSLQNVSCLSPVSVRRLTTLADYLEARVAEDKFDMRSWAGSYETPFVGREDYFANCGSVGCAMGHATEIPEFSDLGLRLEYTGTTVARLAFGGETHFNAASKFMNLSFRQAEYLFADRFYRDVARLDAKRAVVARIRSFVASGGDVPSEINQYEHDD